jgi:hypothetical protein
MRCRSYILRALFARRRTAAAVRENAADDFSLENSADVLTAPEKAVRTFAYLLIAVASVSLVVGAHQHHECHGCLSYGAYARNWPSHGRRSPTARYPKTVFHGSCCIGLGRWMRRNHRGLYRRGVYSVASRLAGPDKPRSNPLVMFVRLSRRHYFWCLPSIPGVET